MKRIMSPPIAVEAFLPHGSDNFTGNLRLTKHCLQITCDDGVLLYHTMTGALVLLEKNETIQDAQIELSQLCFLVEETFDEMDFSRELQQLMATLQSAGGRITSFTVFTTTHCNARCFYCYEKEIRRFTMSEQTAKDTADFIIHSCEGRKVSLHWFGGEPLVNRKVIAIICRRLSAAGIDYSSKIITNGYLFDEDVVDEAKQLWRLKRAHITLDGTKDVYQRIKAYKNGDSQAFERVLSNIDSLLERKIFVEIRLNLNSDNADDIMQLCDFLGMRYGGKRGISVGVVLIRQYSDDVHLFPTHEIAAMHYKAVQKKLQSLGLLHISNLKPSFRCNACMADSDRCVVVYPDGTLGKCEHFNENEIIGSIYSSKRDNDLVQSWKKRKADSPICADCPIYPQCFKLEKCPNNQNVCTPAIRQLRTDNLAERVLSTYRNIKK